MGVQVDIRLKGLLELKDITQKQLAEKNGIRPTAISALVRGYIERINIDHIERIADALDIEDINELITLERDKDEAE